MIRYALCCAQGHDWEAWFDSIAGYDDQAARGLVRCPVCDTADVRKAPMAPAIASGRVALPALPVASHPPPDLSVPEPVREFFNAWRKHVEATHDYVGDAFAREARAIHEGDSEDRPIYGEASPEEARALVEDGVPVAPLPPLASPKPVKGVH